MIIKLEATAEVCTVSHTKISYDGHKYAIVSPTEDIYSDHEYIDWNGALWVKE